MAIRKKVKFSRLTQMEFRQRPSLPDRRFGKKECLFWVLARRVPLLHFYIFLYLFKPYLNECPSTRCLLVVLSEFLFTAKLYHLFKTIIVLVLLLFFLLIIGEKHYIYYYNNSKCTSCHFHPHVYLKSRVFFLLRVSSTNNN